MNNLSETVPVLAGFGIPKYVIFMLVVALFVYIIIYSILQIRQVSLLQKKVQTNIDGSLKFISYVYLLVQVLLFVLALLIL
jgi:hypothetical protein